MILFLYYIFSFFLTAKIQILSYHFGSILPQIPFECMYSVKMREEQSPVARALCGRPVGSWVSWLSLFQGPQGCSGLDVKHQVLYCCWAALELSKRMTFTQLIQNPQSLHSKINAFSWISFKIYWHLDEGLDPAICPHVSDPIQCHGTVYLAIGSKMRPLCTDTNFTEQRVSNLL